MIRVFSILILEKQKLKVKVRHVKIYKKKNHKIFSNISLKLKIIN